MTNDDLDEFGDDLEDAASLDIEEGYELVEGQKRELLTSVLDYNLNTLADLVGAEQIDLSPRYQRRDRWKADRQSRLIESFLMNVPIPPIFLNEDDYGRYSVIDGKQRLTAIYEFMRGRLTLTGLKVFPELNGSSIDDFTPSMRAIIGTRSNLRATIILRQSDKNVKFEVFRRLNTGGVSLNPQEIRNSTWPGPTNDMMLELSEHPLYRQLLGITKTSSSSLYKEMRDVELILRYFTFRNDWSTFSGGMAKRLDRFMADNQRLKRADLAKMQTDFVRTLESVQAAFGEHAFRRYSPETQTWRRPILAALFDAHMFSCMTSKPGDLREYDVKIAEGYKMLFRDAEFRRSIDAATNTPALFKQRIELTRELLNSATDS